MALPPRSKRRGFRTMRSDELSINFVLLSFIHYTPGIAHRYLFTSIPSPKTRIRLHDGFQCHVDSLVKDHKQCNPNPV